MTPFDFVTVALSLILGLGITQLLTSAVVSFRLRDRMPLDWFALAWAGIILFWQLQYWWAVFELNTLVHTWTVLHFVTLTISALLLFVAGALILPSSEQDSVDQLSSSFQRDGRWALLVLSAYFFYCLISNWFLFGVSAISFIGLLVALQTAGPLLFFCARRRHVKTALLIAYVILSLWSGTVMSPAHY